MGFLLKLRFCTSDKITAVRENNSAAVPIASALSSDAIRTTV